MYALTPHYVLTPWTTFGVPVTATYAIHITDESELQNLIKDAPHPSYPRLILGGGSNILFTQDFEGLVILIGISGIEHIAETISSIDIRVGAGENWDEFVAYCVKHGYGGIENLSLIPGSVGATPVQNIGAYGVDISETVVSVETVDLQTGDITVFSNEDCQFAYRSSVFKTVYKNRYAITHVTYRLSKSPQINTSYVSLSQALERKSVASPTIQDVRDTVIELRQSKLPNPQDIGNAGSFFKNVYLSHISFPQLQTTYPSIPGIPVSDDTVKVPAAWLIEQCGWKGYREKDYGVYPYQPLVLVNYGFADGQDIFDLSQRIQRSVYDQFGIMLFGVSKFSI
ncbi:MAG: UDP-N-acetylmuramate dehydrogenase [Candidatus Paceibacteria bacterium]